MTSCPTLPLRLALFLAAVLGLLCEPAAAQCLSAPSALADAMTEPGSGLWLAALALMAGIVWRRQDR